MTPLSEAPVEKKVKKYNFKSELAKEDNRFTKEKVNNESIHTSFYLLSSLLSFPFLKPLTVFSKLNNNNNY